ncbi:hypothetical protein TruAng_005617 [Truncatella angustata]|nr:hypothetical protein TruAng_005617 [Truncatella angustata]
MPDAQIKRVAVVGAGPAGAITIDALAQEKTFDIIRVFERREGPGGCWIGETTQPPVLSDFKTLSDRTADVPLCIPKRIPAQTSKSGVQRFDDSSVYPYLETNIDFLPMEFSQELFPKDKSELSVSTYGSNTPFRRWDVVRRYITGLVDRRGYNDLISYNTTVERAEKLGAEWKLTIRKSGKDSDYWWIEWFDAVVVASGHYWVPYIPEIPGMEQFQKNRPGSVLHSKQFRVRDQFAGKRVVVVGASVSAADIAFDLTNTARTPVHAITIGHSANGYFGDEAFNHPSIERHPSIARVEKRTVHLIDGRAIADVDFIIFGTGYSWSLPFLPQVPVRNNRVPGLYQHIVWQEDPTLLFVGAVAAGLTFKVFEWQAVFVARVLAKRATLPSLVDMKQWETDRIKARGDGVKFTLVFPDFEDYFERLRTMAGDDKMQEKGRKLPKFRREWMSPIPEMGELSEEFKVPGPFSADFLQRE